MVKISIYNKDEVDEQVEAGLTVIYPHRIPAEGPDGFMERWLQKLEEGCTEREKTLTSFRSAVWLLKMRAVGLRQQRRRLLGE